MKVKPLIDRTIFASERNHLIELYDGVNIIRKINTDAWRNGVPIRYIIEELNPYRYIFHLIVDNHIHLFEDECDLVLVDGEDVIYARY